jgi:NADPH:quinone reductase-like Zn-dependent oxidoreductase
VTLEATAAGSMRAIVQDGYGSTDVLRLARMARPEIADSEVLLRVHAAGLDRGTWHLMTGRPYLLRLVCGFRRPRQPVAGLDVAGTIVAVGPGVTRFCAGMRCSGSAGAPSLSTPRPAKTGLPACRATSPSSRPR